MDTNSSKEPAARAADKQATRKVRFDPPHARPRAPWLRLWRRENDR